MISFKEMLIVLCMMIAAGFAGFATYKYIIASQSEVNIINLEPSATTDVNTVTSNTGQQTEAQAVDLASMVVKDIDAKPVGLDQWSGKVLAINFWATWCPPCRKEIPVLIETQKEFADKNVQFLGIAMDDNKAVKSYMQTTDFNYPILISDLNETIRIGQAVNYNFIALPFTVFISADGMQSKAHTGELNKEQIEEILNSFL